MKKINYTPMTNEDVTWVCTAYGHLVKVGETITGEEFARRIREVYDCTRSKNKIAATFADLGVESIGVRKMRDGRRKWSWLAFDDAMLRTNEGVYRRWMEKEGATNAR